MDFYFFKENIVGDRKHSLIIVRSGQCQGPPVPFHNTYRFSKHNTYRFYIKSQKHIYIVLTLVLTQVYRPWVMDHVDTQTTLPELTYPKQPRWSKITVSPYTASISGRP